MNNYYTTTRTITLLLLSFLLSGIYVSAQTVITGTVMDSHGESIPGVAIQIKNSDKGTITDIDGNFNISVKENSSILIFSCLGYETVEEKVNLKRPMKVIMLEDSETLDEILVVGYQEIKKKDLTGSVAKAEMGDLLASPVSSFDQALGGRIAGVNVTSSDGMPGQSTNIVIRGNNSVTQSNSPLFVIDGFPVEDASITNTINPLDIESIDFLKDASATAIYGARGANGVIIITTKKGKAGELKINYDGSCTVQTATKRIPLMDAYEFVRLQNEIYPAIADATYLMEFDGKKWTLDDYRNIEQYDWYDEVLRTAMQQNHNIRISGGSGDIRYNASVAYVDQDGILVNTGYNRAQASAGMNLRRRKLNIWLNINYSHAVQSGNLPSEQSYSGQNNIFYSIWGYRPVTSPDVELETLMKNPTDAGVFETNDYRFNPVLSLQNEYRKYYTDNLRINGHAEYEFIKGLKLKISGGYTYYKTGTEVFDNSNTRRGYYGAFGANGSTQTNERLTWLNENILSYQGDINKTHFFSALAGITFQNSDYKTSSYGTVGVPNEFLGISDIENGEINSKTYDISSWSMLSYLARFNYSYKSRYYITVSFRADGSSKFSRKNRFGYFPSASVAWRFIDEPFMDKLKHVISEGKLRFSWGYTGNNRIGEYARFAILDRSTGLVLNSNGFPSTVYPFGNGLNVGVAARTLPNDDLRWETTEQFNLGIDLGFFEDRISITADLYKKITRDLLLNASLPLSSGYYSATKNIGSVGNQGIELTINTVNIKTGNFLWTSNFNISFNRNKVIALAENENHLFSTVRFDSDYDNQSSYIAKIGYPMGMMFGYIYEGTYKYDDFDKNGENYSLKPYIAHFATEENTQPGMPKYADLNGDGVVDADDRTIIGDGNPVHIGGFTNNFVWKNFDMNIFFQWSYGNDIMNANRLFFESGYNMKRDLNQFASYADRWTPDNPYSDIPSATNSSSNKVISTRIIEDGSFLRLKSITLGYTLPAKITKKARIDKLRIYLAGQNLWTWTGYSGHDPEVSVRNSALTPGLDYSSYPKAMGISLGINLNF